MYAYILTLFLQFSFLYLFISLFIFSLVDILEIKPTPADHESNFELIFSIIMRNDLIHIIPMNLWNYKSAVTLSWSSISLQYFFMKFIVPSFLEQSSLQILFFPMEWVSQRSSIDSYHSYALFFGFLWDKFALNLASKF